MGFAGNYRALAKRMAGNDLGAVLEITLNDATWDPGTGVLTTAMNLSGGVNSARGKAYDPIVDEGGWSGVTQEIQLRAAGLAGLQTDVTVNDTDGRVRAALINGDNRQSSAAIFRVIPGDATAYDRRFTGLLDGWEFMPGQVKLKMKTDDRSLRGNFPQWPYLRSEFFQLDPERQGAFAPIVYGKHDSTGIGLDHGLVPTVGVYKVSGATGWYATNLGPAAFIKDVYVDGVLQVEGALNDYEKFYGIFAGGKIFTIIAFVTIPADGAIVTADLFGYSAVNSEGTLAGADVITNPVAQIRHFLINFAVNRTRAYIPSAWDTTADIIDSASWDAAEDWADNHGLEGSRFLADQKTAEDVFREWLESFPMFRAFWNTDGKIELKVLSPDHPGQWDNAVEVIGREDCLDNSFSYDRDPSDVTGRVSVRYLFDSVQGDYLRSLVVQDLSVGEMADTQFDMPWSPARAT